MSLSPSTLNKTQFQPHLHCPQCGSETVVNHGSKFTCLTCKFSRDVAEKEPESEGLPLPIIAIPIVFFLLIL